MARLQEEQQSWYCGTCRKMRSPNAQFCDLCGQRWQDCISYPAKSKSRKSYVDYYDGYEEDYSTTPWTGSTWTEPRHQSPRRGQREPSGRRTRQKPQKKGKGKGQAKGAEKGASAQQVAAPPPPPPLTGPFAAPAPWTTMPTPPVEVPQEHPAEQKLNEVMNLLKKKKGDQDIQEIVNKYDSYGKKSSKKQMHNAVNDLDEAKNAMADAIQARANLMHNWRTFLTASLDRWKEYTNQFQQQEQKCLEEISQAKEALSKAKTEFLARMPEEAEEISDEDVDLKEQTEAASKILGGMENMRNNLQALAEQAEKDKAEAEERSHKRPRKSSPGNGGDAPMGVAASEASEASKLPPSQSFQQPGQ